MIDTKALREKVLDLAIRGKLVPQDPNDEPATVLLERIREQKKQMVKDGKLKAKDIKNDTIIFKGDDNLHYEQFADGTVKCIEDEIPFEVPDKWVWVRLGNLAQYKKGPFGSSITKAMFIPDSPTAIKVYEQKNAINKNVSLGNYFVSSEKYETLKGFEVFPNDIIVSCAGTIGETYVMPKNMRKGIINQALMKISLYDLEISEFYLMYFDFQLKNEAKEQGYGVALKNIPPFDVLKKYLVPLPPLQEQARIMQQVKALLTVINDIDSNANELSKKIISIKSKILDLAIRGELVPQDPNDEPASVLLERIRTEKEELIKAGKIKRDKKESVIFKGEDNSYYQNVPNNWSIASLSEITTSQLLNDGDWILSDNMDSAGEVKLIQLGSVGFLEYIDKGFKYLTNEMFEYLNCTEIHSGYMLINRIVSDKMTVCILPEISGKKITTVDTCWVAPKENWYNLKFILYSLASPQYQSSVLFYSSGTTRKRISKTNLIALHLAIPPLAEQKRIVEAIEIIFAQLDEITNSIA
ncbi:type I restriction enzyme, S subunit [Peptoniphilus asaccharolyticus DSM 20463]|uniref:Type I restriction enzyme, S subunit n=1 Tax=Peptoniphilus asaccharolyticus DSM 20463 TaxID=573058 RepID=A0A1W1V3B2_PEPAS|nr:restriction endonuclease subunit S [Peptoniphilus asaccharolyticus]MBL7576195.1 restriction endonuclease subunit S [Peptoniphilus asaccharolyticus]SMB87788.1 type I restriction enzyme, S subunit [Peptoniphilus asaccharolyticus DSM 20463]